MTASPGPLGLAGGVALAPLVSPAPPAAAQPGAVDVGFAQDMIAHHEQAVLMAQLVRGRTTDPVVATTAAGIESGRLLEIGQMCGYLQLWDAPTPRPTHHLTITDVRPSARCRRTCSPACTRCGDRVAP